MMSACATDPGTKPSYRPAGPPIVFVVDDDISVREAVEALIRFEGWQAETFASAGEFLAHPRTGAPGCLVLDVKLPDLDGLELQQRIAAVQGEMPIIFITGHGDVPMAVRAMKAGASEFLTKPLSNDALVHAIHDAVLLSEAALKRRSKIAALQARHASLTPRERAVMVRVVAGMPNKQVAGELDISEITVKAHRGSVMRKMQAGSFADLVRMSQKIRLN
jgi:FixJ family two-component response regulator